LTHRVVPTLLVSALVLTLLVAGGPAALAHEQHDQEATPEDGSTGETTSAADEDGEGSAPGGDYQQVVDLTFPVDEDARYWGARYSYFNDYAHPRRRGDHGATDIMVDTGTPIHAAVGGTVGLITGLGCGSATAGALDEPPAWGYAIRVDGDDGREYWYLHFGTNDGPAVAAYAPGITCGSVVERGQHLGYAGYSGNATEPYPHLHFEIHDPAVRAPDGSHRINPYFSLRAAEHRGDYPDHVTPADAAIFLAGPVGHPQAASVPAPLVGDWNGDGRATPGWRIGDRFYLREASGSGPTDVVVRFGLPTDQPVVGDWNGDGTDTIGVRRGSRWLLRDTNQAGAPDHDFVFGAEPDDDVVSAAEPDEVGFVGDWNADGRTTVGVRRAGGEWFLRDELADGDPDHRFVFGRADDAVGVVGDWNGDGRTTVGAWHPDGSWLLRDVLAEGYADHSFVFGAADDAVPVVGDWDGDGRTSVGAVVAGDEWLLRDEHAPGEEDLRFAYGPAPGVPLLGDWNGDGIDTPGWRIGEHFHLQAASPEGEDLVIHYGRQPGDLAVVGDWNGDGRDTIGVWREGRFHLHDELAAGTAVQVVAFGEADDLPVVGDWNGDGRDTVGVRRGDTWLLLDDHEDTEPDHVFVFGREPADEPLVGDWNGDGRDTVGVRRDGRWLLRTALAPGYADVVFAFGDHPADVPVVGAVTGGGRDTAGILHDTSWSFRDAHSDGEAAVTMRFLGVPPVPDAEASAD
jgi:murein DD-endopeptidase MepM/ murein hydrolase activator NlpD